MKHEGYLEKAKPFLKELSVFLTVSVLLFSFDLPWLYAARAHSSPKKLYKQADVVLEVSPLRARPLRRGAAVDAVENDPTRRAFAEAVVSFKIERVLKGEWIQDTLGGPTRMEQLGKAMREKNFAKILGLDLSDPNAMIDRPWVSIAVENPGETFGLTRWDSPDPTLLKIYFKKVPNQKNSFVMIGVVPC